MAKTSKTLRDYILKEGIKGRHFVDTNNKIYLILGLNDLPSREGFLEVRYMGDPGRIHEIELVRHYLDLEATLNQIKRFRKTDDTRVVDITGF